MIAIVSADQLARLHDLYEARKARGEPELTWDQHVADMVAHALVTEKVEVRIDPPLD
jgi:hypothetical protein